MSQVFSGIPGEPDDLVPANTPPPVADAGLPTGTPMDLAGPDEPIDMSDPMAAGLAAFFEHQAQFRQPVPGMETASAQPTPAPAPQDSAQAPVAPVAPSVPPAPEGTPHISRSAEDGSGLPVSTQAPDSTPDEPSSAVIEVPAGEPPVEPPATSTPTPQPAAATPPLSEGHEGLSATPPETPPVSEATPWVPQGHVLLGERPIPEAEVPNILRVYDWARSMPPELAQAIRDLESGNFILTPRSAPQSPQYSPPASGSGVPPTPDSSGGGWGQPPSQPQQYDPSQSLDPALAQQVQYLAQQQAQLQASMQQQAAQQQAQQRAAFEAQIESARTTFSTDPNRNLSAPEMHYLTDRVASMQMFPSLIQQHNGDVTKAMIAALDAAYWADPEFRNRHTASDVQTQVDKTMLANQEMQAKRQRAASLAGTSTPVSRTPPSAAPLTRETATNGMVSAITEALQGSSNNGN